MKKRIWDMIHNEIWIRTYILFFFFEISEEYHNVRHYVSFVLRVDNLVEGELFTGEQ